VTALINIEKPIGKCIASALDISVTREPVQIGLHAQDAKRPGARTGERQRCRDCGFEESPRRSSQSRISRMAQHVSQGPQRAAMAVIRPNVFKPFAVVTEKVSEPSGVGMKRKPQKGKVAMGKIWILAPAPHTRGFHPEELTQ
jgi:hypothetical protein